MGEYVDVVGHSTWVETAGAGSETVLLLHGGLSNSDDLLDTVGSAIGEHYRMVAFDRRGHGRTADIPGPLHYDEMATDTIAVLEQIVGGAAHLIGWSDGGIIALLVARQRPDLVGRMVLIGANFHHDGLRGVNEDGASDFMRMIGESYAAKSPDGADHFGLVVKKTLTMFGSEPTMSVSDLTTIEAPTLVLVGDDDLIELSHTCALYEALPNGQLAVVPAASHALVVEKPAIVAALIVDFLAGPAQPQTLMPSRRGSA
jgi:pimeloyl-ACP methyl ester carboxylesterase